MVTEVVANHPVREQVVYVPVVVEKEPAETVAAPLPVTERVTRTQVREVTSTGPAGKKGEPDVFVNNVPATLNFTPNGDGTYGIEVTL